MSVALSLPDRFLEIHEPAADPRVDEVAVDRGLRRHLPLQHERATAVHESGEVRKERGRRGDVSRDHDGFVLRQCRLARVFEQNVDGVAKRLRVDQVAGLVAGSLNP